MRDPVFQTLTDDHERCHALAERIAEVAQGRYRRRAFERGLLEIISESHGWLLPHLRLEHKELLPVLEARRTPQCDRLAEDLIVDQAVLRNALTATRFSVETGEDPGRALAAFEAGLRSHVKLFEHRLLDRLQETMEERDVHALRASLDA